MLPQDRNPITSTRSMINDNDKNIPQVDKIAPETFEGFWGDMFDSCPEGVLIVDHDRKPLLINAQIKEIWDMPSNLSSTLDALNQNSQKVIDPEAFRNRINDIYKDKDCVCQDIVKFKDGRIFERNTKPLIINGSHLGRFWTYRDTTTTYQTERALKESEAKYRILYAAEQQLARKMALLDRVRVGVASELDLTSLFQNTVESIADAFGYTLVSLYMLNNNKLHLQHQVGYHTVIEEVPMGAGISGDVMRSGKAVLVEDVSLKPNFLAAIDGIVSEICVPLFDKEVVVGMLNIESIDNIKLTESDLELAMALSDLISPAISRARLYTQVKAQERQLRSIFDLAPIGFLLTTLDGTFVQVNRAFEDTIGYSEDELLKMKFIDITHPDDVEHNLKLMGQLVKGEIATYSFEKRYIHRNGSFINAFLQVSCIPSQANQPARLIAQVVNLTDLKKAERALLQHQKMESIGVLAGGIAHDFNNLLVALKTQSSLALMRLPNESPARIHIDKVSLAADSAAKLTQQLLAYSGQGQFKIEHIDLNHEVYQNSQLLEVAIPKNVYFKIHLASNLPQIVADNGQIQQILMNLIINAAESFEEAAGTITLATEVVYIALDDIDSQRFILPPTKPGVFVETSIMDDGQGMDADTLSKIFDPFFTTKFTGRGLGLAAVLGIVRSHNGGLSVTSKVGQGTKFQVYFPVAVTPKNQLAKSGDHNYISQSKIKKPNVSKNHVLLIDDDNLVRETMVDLFELENISVICAADGTEGIAKLQAFKQQITIVLLDLSMPGISSEETFMRLREIKPSLSILLCSGYSELRVSDYFANQNYEGFIAKPFDINNLIKRLREFI